MCTSAVADYFGNRLHDKSCGCCIRLATLDDGTRSYKTHGRSWTLGVGRDENSEPILEESDFIEMIKKEQSQGVWGLNDLGLRGERRRGSQSSRANLR